MRVVWVSHSGKLGGAERSLAEAAGAMVQRGHELHVVLPSEGPLRGSLEGSATVHVQPHNPWTTTPGVSAVTKARWLAYDVLVAAPAIAALARRVDADVVISQTVAAVAGALAARRARRPHVWSLHEFGLEDHGLRFIPGTRIATALMDRWSDLFLVNSYALGRHYGALFSPEKIRRVQYAVDVPPFETPAPTMERTLRLVLAGLKTRSKGQHEAITALGLLVADGLDVELTLVGDGDQAYERELDDLAVSLGVEQRVHSIPFTPSPLDVIADADVALMCSRAEAFGRVTVEALKAGKPVVASESGGTPELVRHGENGLLYESGKPAELAKAVRMLYEDRALLRLMGDRGRAWATQTFTREACGEMLEAALATVQQS